MTRLPLSNKHINSHMAITGDTGSGKSLLTEAYLRNVERRGEVAIVWDPEREHAKKFRSINRRDTVLDPTCTEVPYWAINQEYKDEGEAMALSSCFFPDNPGVKDPFWNNSARGLLTLLSALHKPTVSDLGFWCADDFQIDSRVVGTEYERILTNNAPGFRSSIVSHLNQIAQPLRMMPQHPDGRRTFTVKNWCETRQGWVFITSSPSYSTILNPLHTFFMSSFIQRLVAMGQRKDLPRVHLVFQEASTVQVQEFHTALIRLRKTGTPVVYALQSPDDLKPLLGDRAGSAISQPYYKVFFRAGSAEVAKQGSATIGKKTVRRLKESIHRPGTLFGRTSRTFFEEKEDVAIVPEQVLLNLPDRVGYIVSPQRIARFKMPIMEMPDRLPALQTREIPPMIRRLPQQQPIQAPQPQEADVRQNPDGQALLPLGQSYF